MGALVNTELQEGNTIIEMEKEIRDIKIPELDYLDELSKFIFTSKYARYNEEKERRETLDEVVDRVLNMHLQRYQYLSKKDQKEIEWAFEQVRNRLVVPSMRSMQFGGNAVFAHNARIYNCAARHIDSIRSFAESFYLLLCGTGATFGLNKKYLNRLPDLVNENDKTGVVVNYVVEDTIEGWADSVEAQLMCYFKNTPYTGRKIIFDYSRIRAKGTPLKTGGGKAPGHKGLQLAHERIKAHLDYVIETKNLSRLRSIDAYDIMMHCADAVLSGGIRRAATMIIFDKNDEDMINSKTVFDITHKTKLSYNKKKTHLTTTIEVDGRQHNLELHKDKDAWAIQQLRKDNKVAWNYIYPWRARSNNSIRLLRNSFDLKELQSIIDRTMMYGEPGFVFADHEDTLFNPCAEIGFIPVTEDGRCGYQFCNLTSQNGAMIKSLEDWKTAIRAATIIGTLQAGYTEFPYLSHAAKELTEQEALLGVSMTGWMDNPDLLLNPENQYMMAKLATKINEEWSSKIGIKPAARVTCVKPEGTSSLFLKSASGIHPHHAHKYIRRVQANKIDPVYKYFKKFNKAVTEESVWSANKTDDVVSFPVELPDNVMVKSDLTAIKHLDIVRSTQINWVDAGKTRANKKNVSHNVSCTIEVDKDEWDKVVEYLYKNQTHFAAVSLIGKTGDTDYAQAPNERVTEKNAEEFERLKSSFVSVDYTEFSEKEDKTSLMDTAACAGPNGSCDITFVHPENS